MQTAYFDREEGAAVPLPPEAPPEPAPQVEQAVPEPPAAELAPVRPALARPAREKSELGAVLVLISLVLILCGAGVLVLRQWDFSRPQAAAPADPAPTELPQTAIAVTTLQPAPTGDGTVLKLLPRPEGEAKSLRDIYREVNPAIVSVQAFVTTGGKSGTGVLMTEDGYIITNRHVVEDAFRVQVSLDDGRGFEAVLVGWDTPSDLAVLKVKAKGLPCAVFGDSEAMAVGDPVAAIGNPMGEQLRGTMTDGILSAINRDIEVSGQSMTLLQTTAALNVGNSGGALVNDQGQVIGITNMKISAPGSNEIPAEGLGFAIPSATVKTVVDDLIAWGYVKGRPGLGITVIPLSARERQENGVDCGLWVADLVPGCDAADKLRVGDILLTANGCALHVNDDLLQVRDGLQVGQTIRFTVLREGQTLEAEVGLRERYELYG